MAERRFYPVEAWDVLQSLFQERSINDHTLHFMASFSGKLDSDRLKKAAELSADAFPLIRCSFSSAGRRPRWEEQDFAADELVRYRETGNAEEEAGWFLCARIDASAGPQVRFGVFRSGGKDTLAVLMNHMLCDAAGFKEYLYLLCGIYTALEQHAEICPAGSGSRRIGQLLKGFSARDKVKILTSRNDMLTHDPAGFDLEGDPANPFIEKRVIPREAFLNLISYAKSRRATVNDAMLAAYLRVLYRRFGRTVAVPSTVDLRKYLPGRRAEGFCNLCTNLTCDIGPELGGSFGETLDRVKRAMDREKASIACLKSLLLLEKGFDVLPYRTAEGILGKVFSNARIAFTNIGVLDRDRLSFGSAEIVEAYMTGSIKYSPYFQLAISTYGDQAVLSVNLYGTLSDRKKISAFLDDILLELRAVS